MSDGDILFTFLALLFVGWVCYGVGKRVGFAQMRKAEKLRDLARAEMDREKKADLSIKANQAEDPDSPRTAQTKGCAGTGHARRSKGSDIGNET
jgi:hypothetical protein